MEDADNSYQPSKKRAAGVQLTRDNPGLDDNEDSSEMEAGTFKKASDEVLATRRIVKVRRQQASSIPAAAAPSPASNPFAAIRLVPTASSAPPAEAEAHSGKSNETEKTDGIKLENKIDNLKDESTAENKKTNVNDDIAKETETTILDSESGPQSVVEEVIGGNLDDGVKKPTSADNSEAESKKDTKGEENDKEKENVEVVMEGGNPDDGVENITAAHDSEIESKKDVEGEGNTKEEENPEDVGESRNPDDLVEKAAAADNGEAESKKDPKDEGNGEKKENVEASGEKSAGTVSFGLFQQLSNSQNAFSGFTGTGFSSSSFSFGSSNKDGHSLGSGSVPLFGLNNGSGFGRNSGPVTGFGPNNRSSSIFGTSGTTASQNEGSKFPPMQDVPVETGEENEKSVFTADSVLFEYINGTWKERGKGEVKVNVPTTGTGKARLIMRVKGNYRLILNASLFPDMKLTNMDKKGITFACMNSASEGKEGLSTVALRFKDASIVEEFVAVVTEYKSKIPPTLETPENSPKA